MECSFLVVSVCRTAWLHHNSVVDLFPKIETVFFEEKNMSQATLQDAQWLKSLPQTLGFDFERFFWGQPEEATAWFGFDEAIALADVNGAR